MFRFTRSLHKIIGLIAALFLAIIAVTGFLLATKDTFGWIKPPSSKGAKMESFGEVVPMNQVGEAVFALGIAELKVWADIERVDYRPSKNIFKVLSERGYHEIQVDGKTGEVLSVSSRNDQLSEDIHDLSFFADWMHAYWLPVVAVILLTLAISGVGMYFTPVVRRWKFKRKSKE
ncbi:MAG: PepSY domain-containing protein [Fimbriimonadaceae bacterium]|nr:PepSY domain-containing protein [Fimbriimonadaceae bacterium]